MSRSFAAIWVTAILVALSNAPASAQIAPYGSIGLYVDEARSSNEVSYSGPYTEFTMYVFVKPGPQGMSGVEFAIKYPSNVLAGEVTSSPLLSVEFGNLAEGTSAAFLECQNDWVWTHQQLMYLRDASPSRIEVVKHPLSGAYQATNCELGYQLESLLLSSSVCLNSTCEPDTTAPVITGAENTSSTAITLAFSEPLVRQAAENPLNYEVVDLDDPTATPVISQAELLSGDRSVGVYLTEPLIFGRTYFVRVHGIFDLWGNAISPTSQTSFTPYERGPLLLKSISSEGDSALYVEFNRPPAPALAENAANYRVYRLPPIPGYPNHGLCSAQPFSASLVTQLRVRLAFVETKLPCETQLYLKVNNITDTAGNPLASPYDIMGFTIPDLTPPAIRSVSAIDRRTVTAYFNEIVRDSTVNVPGNYVICRQADTAATVPVIGALITAGKNGVKLRLGADLSPDATYVLRARGIMDVKGNRMPAWNTCGFNGSAPAQVPPYGSIGLYVDEVRSANSVSYSGPYTEFTMYVFVKPGEQGLTGVEFAIKYPSNVLASDVTSSPLLSVEFGNLADGNERGLY